MQVRCTSCGCTFEVEDRQLGKLVECPLCGRAVDAQPASATMAPPPPLPSDMAPPPPPTGMVPPPNGMMPPPPTGMVPPPIGMVPPPPIGMVPPPVEMNGPGLSTMQRFLIYLGMTILPILGTLAWLFANRASETEKGFEWFALIFVLSLILPLVLMIVNHVRFFMVWKNNRRKAIHLLVHTWAGIAATILFLCGIGVFNNVVPEVFFELKTDKVESLTRLRLQELFNMPSNGGEEENGKYIYAGAVVKSLKLEHTGRCQFEGRIFFELDGQEYSRPIIISYARNNLSDNPEWIFDLTHGGYENTPDELREDVIIAFRDWLQSRNEGLDNWKIEDIGILSSTHPRYNFQLKCVRIGNTGKKHFGEMKMVLTFKTLSSGRYHPVMSFYDIDHEIHHSFFIYHSLGRKMKDGTVIKECRLKKCTGKIDTFMVRYSDNVVNSIYVSFGDDFSWKTHDKER